MFDQKNLCPKKLLVQNILGQNKFDQKNVVYKKQTPQKIGSKKFYRN